MAGCSRVPLSLARCVRLYVQKYMHGDAFQLFLQKQNCLSAKAPPELQRNVEDSEAGGASYVCSSFSDEQSYTEQPGSSAVGGPLTTVKRRFRSRSEKSGFKYESLCSPRLVLLAAFGLR